MSNARMFPPGDGRHTSITVNGRTYAAVLGGYIDVPTFDAEMLVANRWVRAGGSTCLVGPTSARPTSAPGGQPITEGQSYIDTTLGYTVTWDRKAWRSTINGVAV